MAPIGAGQGDALLRPGRGLTGTELFSLRWQAHHDHAYREPTATSVSPAFVSTLVPAGLLTVSSRQEVRPTAAIADSR
jgi:hypothetical protein